MRACAVRSCWTLRQIAAGITQNHKNAVSVPGGWTPLSWDEEHPDDPYEGDAWKAFGLDFPPEKIEDLRV